MEQESNIDATQTNIEAALDWIQLANSLKWPFVVLIGLLIFRKPLVDLINRITKVGYGTKSLEAKQQVTVSETKTEEISHIDRVVGLFRPETIEMFKEAVSNESEYQNLDSNDEKIERLINYGCLLYIMRHFDIIYNNIFGSQIRILEYVNSHSAQTKESVKFFYDTAVKNHSKYYENYSYNEYLNFLFHFTLIREDNGELNITILGVDFLKYLTESNKDVNKLY
ncbi:hypothetical protein L3X39_05180 [Sabulilitoribacter multivorans]|uniref:DUF4129 domain-containing protein n=1 Tax=Flaviramulus multivorans TaxID=1304750 RepID=A0ABS9IGY6_9FLAO|nr:hypothetical protein [Flaviramulus multivorans]MCF7560022.1 hypothetical protein [Flaviramulus multivorans]